MTFSSRASSSRRSSSRRSFLQILGLGAAAGLVPEDPAASAAEVLNPARHIDIRLDDTDDKLVLRITDDGVGFDVKNIELSKDRGIGLSNMRERVERNGGTFALISQPGHTSLIASFPLVAA